MKPLETLQDFESYLSTFTNYERQQIPRQGPPALKLERMREILRRLGDPHHELRAVHVAGTKGKGSTSLILEALLAAAGFRVGTYTSPHVEVLNERIRLDGRAVTDRELVALANDALGELEATRRMAPDLFPTFFELMTALAMVHFARARPDWCIFEVGLGGRLDATNVLAPRWTAITTVALEHTHILGSTHAEIAREKAGIIKEGIPVVPGILHPEARREVERIAARRRAPLIVAEPERLLEPAGPGRLRLAGLGGPLAAGAVHGPGLRADLAVALEIYRGILAGTGRRVELAEVSRALASLELPGRVELFPGDPPVLLDGAHTADSFLALRETLEELDFPRPRTLVLALASDKRREAILPVVREIADEAIVTRADPVRGLPAGRLLEALGWGEAVSRPEAALDRALARGRAVVVTGSLYLAGALRPRLAARQRLPEATPLAASP